MDAMSMYLCDDVQDALFRLRACDESVGVLASEECAMLRGLATSGGEPPEPRGRGQALALLSEAAEAWPRRESCWFAAVQVLDLAGAALGAPALDLARTAAAWLLVTKLDAETELGDGAAHTLAGMASAISQEAGGGEVSRKAILQEEMYLICTLGQWIGAPTASSWVTAILTRFEVAMGSKLTEELRSVRDEALQLARERLAKEPVSSSCRPHAVAVQACSSALLSVGMVPSAHGAPPVSDQEALAALRFATSAPMIGSIGQGAAALRPMSTAAAAA